MKEYIDPEIVKWIITVLFVSVSVLVYFVHYVECMMSILYYFIPSAKEIEESVQIYRTKAWQQNYVHLDKSLLPIDQLLESLQSEEKGLVRRWVFLNKGDYHRNKELFEFSTATAQYFDNNSLGKRIKKNVPQFMYAHDTLGEQKLLLLLVKCMKNKKTYFPLAIVLSAEGDAAPSHQLLYEEAKLLMEKVETIAIADMGSLSLCDSMDSLHELFSHMRFQERRLPLWLFGTN